MQPNGMPSSETMNIYMSYNVLTFIIGVGIFSLLKQILPDPLPAVFHFTILLACLSSGLLIVSLIRILVTRFRRKQ